MSQRWLCSGGDSCAAAASRTLLALPFWSAFAQVPVHHVALEYLLLVRPSNFDPFHISEGCDLADCTFRSFSMSFVSLCNPDLASISMLTLFVTSPHVASEYRLLVRPSIIDPSHITVGCDLVGCTFLPHSMSPFYYETRLSSPAPCRS